MSNFFWFQLLICDSVLVAALVKAEMFNRGPTDEGGLCECGSSTKNNQYDTGYNTKGAGKNKLNLLSESGC